MNESTAVDFCGDRISVMTKTKVFFMQNPQSAVIPFLLEGHMTPDKGFIVHYSTTDEQILRSLHEALCRDVGSGNYKDMSERVRMNQCVFTHAGERLGKYITGYKY